MLISLAVRRDFADTHFVLTATAAQETFALAALFVAGRPAGEILSFLSASELLAVEGNGPLGHVFARLSSIAHRDEMPVWQARRLAPVADLARGAMLEMGWLCERWEDEIVAAGGPAGLRALRDAMRAN